MTFCSNCGTQNEPGAEFCIKCGTKIAAAPAAAPQPYAHPGSHEYGEYGAKSAGLAAILSFLIPGVGQMYAGQPGRMQASLPSTPLPREGS